jgi:hypothetical protein
VERRTPVSGYEDDAMDFGASRSVSFGRIGASGAGRLTAIPNIRATRETSIGKPGFSERAAATEAAVRESYRRPEMRQAYEAAVELSDQVDLPDHEELPDIGDEEVESLISEALARRAMQRAGE